MMKEVPLIKVKTLSKTMARQIQIVSAYGDEVYRKLVDGMAADTVRPLAWAMSEAIGIDSYRMWLVEYEGQLYWMTAPYGGRASPGTPPWMEVCCKNLPQIFIG